MRNIEMGTLLFPGGPVMKWVVTVSMMVLMATGCSSKGYWMKEGCTQEQYTMEEYDCQYKAQTMGALMRGTGGGNLALVILTQKNTYKDCMKAKGYKWVKEQNLTIQKTSHRVAIDTYYPLDKGRTWVYQISWDAADKSLGGGNGQVIVTNFAQRALQGKKVTPQKADLGGETAFIFIAQDEKGIYEFAKQGPKVFEPEIKSSPNYYIRMPIQVGTTWDDEYETLFLVEKISLTVTAKIDSLDEIVTVPAGTFEKCLKVSEVGHVRKNMGQATELVDISIESYKWYAPGVGIVKEVVREKSNHRMLGQAVMQLESFKKY